MEIIRIEKREVSAFTSEYQVSTPLLKAFLFLKVDFVEFHKGWWKLEKQIKKGMNSEQKRLKNES